MCKCDLPHLYFFSLCLSHTLSISVSTKSFLHLLSLGMADLMRLLLQVAEKAANVARVCRQEAPLFQLLVQEKTGEDKNKKFVQDFKTLADVVIQEMIRHDVGAQVGRVSVKCGLYKQTESELCCLLITPRVVFCLVP